IRQIVAEVNQATGGQTEIGGLDFSLTTLTVHLYNVTVHGTEPAGVPPLLHIDRLTVGIKILSAIHHKINLTELVIVRPVGFHSVDRSDKNQVPTSQPSQSKSNTNVFDLAVGHVGITDGQVNYNDQTIPVAVDLFNLDTDINFSSLTTRYSGSISYDT